MRPFNTAIGRNAITPVGEPAAKNILRNNNAAAAVPFVLHHCPNPHAHTLLLSSRRSFFSGDAGQEVTEEGPMSFLPCNSNTECVIL